MEIETFVCNGDFHGLVVFRSRKNFRTVKSCIVTKLLEGEVRMVKTSEIGLLNN